MNTNSKASTRKGAFKTRAKQQGVASAVYLGIAVLVIFVGGVAQMSRTAASGVADQAAKTHVNVIRKLASDYKDAFDRKLISQSLAAADITFDKTAITGLFDPTAGAQDAVLSIPPKGAFITSATPAFTYSNLVQLPGIGSSGGADYVITVGELTLKSCQLLNMLHGDAASATPATSAGSLADWTTTPAAVNDSASVAVNYLNRAEGCVATSDAAYVYYKAVVEN